MAVDGRHYDPEQIGARLACLGDHRVYRYGADAVIKFSQFDWCRQTNDLPHFYRQEVAFLQGVFGDYFVETLVVEDPAGCRVGLRQPFIHGEPLSKRHLSEATIREQVQDIMSRLQSVQRRGEYLDLIGGGPQFFTAWLGNIFVTPEKRLVIIDASVLRGGDFAWWCRIPVRGVIWLGNTLLARRIRKLTAGS